MFLKWGSIKDWGVCMLEKGGVMRVLYKSGGLGPVWLKTLRPEFGPGHAGCAQVATVLQGAPLSVGPGGGSPGCSLPPWGCFFCPIVRVVARACLSTSIPMDTM